jgi:hypothetical protein
MAAHVPRRTFSTPFIVTVAAAASAVAGTACEHTYDNPPPPPRVPESNEAAPDSGAATATTNASAAPPGEAAAGATKEAAWTITRDEKTNTCVTRQDVDCVMTKDALGMDHRTCKQGPPAPYACPAGVLTFPAWVRREKGEAKCSAAWEPASPQCPPIATCNPPGTQYADVPCPK